MGPKKKNPRRSSSKQCLPSTAADGDTSGNQDSLEVRNMQKEVGVLEETLSYMKVRVKGAQALLMLSQGRHAEALSSIREACSSSVDPIESALLHRVQGIICAQLAAIINDPKGKQQHMDNAIGSAKKAAELSPNSIDFAHFYAKLLYVAAKECQDYENVVQECQRALALENPVDPAKENLDIKTELTGIIAGTTGTPIAQVQNQLKALIQRSSIAFLSTWMKNLGNSEKVRLVTIRRVTEAPKDVKNEAKPLETKVAAARLLQQQAGSPEVQTEGETKEGELDYPSRGRRRKQGSGRKSGATSDRQIRTGSLSREVEAYWNSMSLEMKKDILCIKISDLKTYFRQSNHALANKVITEALSFAVANNKSWKFWSCSRCIKKFPDSESYLDHVMQEHIGSLSPQLLQVLPHDVDSKWSGMLVNWPWKPLDILVANKLLEIPSESQGFNNDCKNCSEDARDSSCEKETLGYADKCSTEDGKECDDISSLECKVCEDIEEPVSYVLSGGWPISNDKERKKLLDRIFLVFGVLIKAKFLSGSLLDMAIKLAMADLQILASGTRLLNHKLDQTPACICFLGATQLSKILEYLQELSDSCGLGRYAEIGLMKEIDEPREMYGIMDDDSCCQDSEDDGDFVLSDDGTCLLLNELLLSNEKDNPATENVYGETSGSGKGNMVSSWEDKFLNWTLEARSSGMELATWMRSKEEKGHQGIETVRMLDKNFVQLQSLCKKKREHVINSEIIDRRCIINSPLKICKIEASMMQKLMEMERLELKLKAVSSQDYRSILSPLLKSYMMSLLKGLAEKDAVKKSDAAIEALLAELAVDSKTGLQRPTQDKDKDKKKKKKKRKTKAFKPNTIVSDQVNDKTAESSSVPVATDAHHTESVDTKLQEEELSKLRRLEEEERMLGESIENQNRILNEVKMKHFAKQQEKSSRPVPVDNVSDVAEQHKESGQSVPVEISEGAKLHKEFGLAVPVEVSDKGTEQHKEFGLSVRVDGVSDEGARQHKESSLSVAVKVSNEGAEQHKKSGMSIPVDEVSDEGAGQHKESSPSVPVISDEVVAEQHKESGPSVPVDEFFDAGPEQHTESVSMDTHCLISREKDSKHSRMEKEASKPEEVSDGVSVDGAVEHKESVSTNMGGSNVLAGGRIEEEARKHAKVSDGVSVDGTEQHNQSVSMNSDGLYLLADESRRRKEEEARETEIFSNGLIVYGTKQVKESASIYTVGLSLLPEESRRNIKEDIGKPEEVSDGFSVDDIEPHKESVSIDTVGINLLADASRRYRIEKEARKLNEASDGLSVDGPEQYKESVSRNNLLVEESIRRTEEEARKVEEVSDGANTYALKLLIEEARRRRPKKARNPEKGFDGLDLLVGGSRRRMEEEARKPEEGSDGANTYALNLLIQECRCIREKKARNPEKGFGGLDLLVGGSRRRIEEEARKPEEGSDGFSVDGKAQYKESVSRNALKLLTEECRRRMGKEARKARTRL